MYQKKEIQYQIESLIVWLTRYENTFSFWSQALDRASRIESLLHRSWFETKGPAESQDEMREFQKEADDLYGLFMIIEHDSRYGRPSSRDEARRALSRYATLLVSIEDSEV
jgi:hypothetical protein